ncbi:hypothetical protein D1872_300490 [compost metagenome]
MVLAHIPQSAGVVVISAALLDADRFAQRDLHVGDVLVVPKRFKERVRKADHFDILNHLFAEIVIDPIDFLFLKDLVQLFIQLLCGEQIIAERLLDNQTIPAVPI